MRRTIIRRRRAIRAVSGLRRYTVPNEAELGPQAVDHLGLLEHHFVLLLNVALEPGKAFFQAIKACVGHGARDGRPSRI